MTTIQADIIIDAAPRDIWPALADVSYVHHWHPRVERSPALTDRRTGVGAQRICHFYDGNTVKEEVRESIQEKFIAVAIVEASMPIQNAVASFELAPLSDGKTQVTVQMDYQTRYGPLGWLMDQLMMQRMMRGMLTEVLSGLQTHVVEGVYIGKDGARREAVG